MRTTDTRSKRWAWLALLCVPFVANAADEFDLKNMPVEFVPGFNAQYARNDDRVFRWTCSSAPKLASRRCWQPSPDMQPASFAPVAYQSDTGSAPSRYFKDQQGVYFQTTRLDAGDPAMFRALSPEWAISQKGVFYAGELQPQIDAASLTLMDHGWARDRQRAYYMGAVVPEAATGSLRVLSVDYAVDHKHVYHHGRTLKGGPQIDAASFQSMGGNSGYAKDARSAFYDGRRIPDADSESFVFLGNCYARDAQHIYYCGKPMEFADAESFAMLDDSFAIDNDWVYFKGAAVQKADRSTFRPFNDVNVVIAEVQADAEDKNNWYEVVSSNLVITSKAERQRPSPERNSEQQ